MTSFAFIFGVIPLVVAHGAGAEMRSGREARANGRDQVAPSTTPEWVSPAHANVRGPAHYH